MLKDSGGHLKLHLSLINAALISHLSFALISVLVLGGCKGTQGTSTKLNNLPTPPASIGPKNVQISWNANHEKTVNSAGGGYKVYYSTTQNFNLAGATLVNVPYSSGATAPTSIVIPSLGSGTYYIKVVAYSSINTTGSVSQQTSVTVP